MAGFFQSSGENFSPECLDLILKRYSSPEFVLNLPFEEGIELIRIAEKNENEDKLYRQWIAYIPIAAITGDERFSSFESYKAELRRQAIIPKTQTAEEIIAHTEALMKNYLLPGGNRHGV